MRRSVVLLIHLLFHAFDVSSGAKPCSGRFVNLDELKGCDRIQGDLLLRAYDTDPQFPLRITGVPGCIRIESTFLTNLDWLDVTETGSNLGCNGREIDHYNKITYNSDLCLTPRITRIVKNWDIRVEGNMPEDCHLTCPGPNYVSNYPRNVYQEVECHFINGTLNIFDVEGSAAPFYKSLEKIEEVNNGSIDINNIALSKIDFFPVLKSISPLDDEPNIIIRNNANLENIVLPPQLTNKPKIVVRGNRKLSQETLDKLKAAAAEGSEIQEQGECGFSLEVEDASVLKGCSVISSDLHIAPKVEEVTQIINYLAGCIFIEFTKLKHLHFLKLDERMPANCGVSVIELNEELCLYPREKRLLKKLYNATINGNKADCGFDKHCTDGTSFADLMKDEFECAEVGGEILLTGSAFWEKSIQSIQKIIDGHVVVKHTSLTSFDLFKQLKQLNTTLDHEYAFVVENNTELTNITFSPSLRQMKIQVRGNKKLSQNTIDYLKREMSSDSDIQSHRECHSVNEPSDLNGCSSIYKDLNLISTQITKVDETITAVGGCIQIKNTSLKNLNFLQLKDTATVNCAGGSVIENNKDLCVYARIEKILKNVYKAVIKNNAPEDCASVCDASSLEQNYNSILSNQQTCIKLLGSLVIRHQHVPQAWFSLLKDVETIDGGNIVIENNQFADVNILPKLKNITNYSGNEPAISIRNNPNLNQFTLPALHNIEAPNAELYFKIEKNPKLIFSRHKSEVLSRFPSKKIDYDLMHKPLNKTPSSSNSFSKTYSSNMVHCFVVVVVLFIVF